MASAVIRGVLNGAKNGAKAVVKNGGKAAKAVVKNGDNGNGALKNGAEALTGGDLARQAYVDNHPKVIQTRQNYGSRGPGSPVRAKRPTQTLGPRSVISTKPNKMIKAYPEEKEKIERWMRGAYSHARDPSKGTKKYPLKDYPNYLGPDGRKWRPKPSQGAFEGYQLKGDDKQARSLTIQRRTNREKPWTKQDEKDKIYDALLKIGKEHLFDDLLKLMKSDFDKGIAALNGQTKGHFISMANGGLDVAENFGPQAGRSTRSVVNGQLRINRGNFSEQAASTTGFGAGRGVDNYDDYVRMKLSKLE